jgi:hypothetical protein
MHASLIDISDRSLSDMEIENDDAHDQAVVVMIKKGTDDDVIAIESDDDDAYDRAMRVLDLAGKMFVIDKFDHGINPDETLG